MTTPARATALLLALTGLGAAGCGGGTNAPTAPTPSPPGGGTSSNASCRTYATSQTVTVQSGGTTKAMQLTASFNVATNQFTEAFSGPDGGPCQTTVTTYASRGAFIDEVRVVPGVTLSTGYSLTSAPGCGGGAVVTHQYDQRGRLETIQITGSDGPGSVTFTQWDSAGRPLFARFAPSGLTTTFTHNDGTRTTRTVTEGGSQTVVAETAFDSDGIRLSDVVLSPPPVVTSTHSTRSTERVCR